jgi:Na+/H+ antiporter NhaC
VFSLLRRMALMSDYSWLSIVPPILAITLALLFRQVIPALLAGVWAGAIIIEGNLFTAVLRVGDTYLVNSLAEKDHAVIVMFSMILGGMIGVLSKNGGTGALVNAVTFKLTCRKNGQIATGLMGLVIFFDDYANTLLVGNTMRPLTDRLNISRQKLAYIIDSTAAPVATIAVISTWIGFEVGLIQDSLARISENSSAYVLFLRSLPYNFYPILTLFFVFAIAVSGRDFGPMAKAESKAINAGIAGEVDQTLQSNSVTKILSAVVPLLVIILATVVGLYFDGANKTAPGSLLREILSAADSFSVLMWSALGGSIVAVGMSKIFGLLTVSQSIEAWLEGGKKMLPAFVILLLAWSIGAVCEELGTASFLVSIVDGVLEAQYLPVVTFILAALVSFATGTSWGTMAILVPIIVPLAVNLAGADGVESFLLPSTISAVLAGAVFGDHCSPISDTTILSSMASGSDHIEHVRTQLPYALTVALVAIVVGYLPVGMGVPPWLSLLAGCIFLGLIIRFVGKKSC